jgi:hypothetical protein
MSIFQPHPKTIVEKYWFLCGFCLVKPAAGVYQIVPNAEGGAEDEENQIPLCEVCYEIVKDNWMAYEAILHHAQRRARATFQSDIQVGKLNE